MLKQRLTITLANSTLEKIDQLIDKKEIRSRSHAIETILQQHLETRVETAVILAGGKSENNQIQKPLISYLNKPLIVHTLEHLKEHNVKNIIFLCNKFHQEIKLVVKKNFPELKLISIEENEPLGTAGAIKNASSHLPDVFFCLHSDIFTKIDLQQLANFHSQNQAVATIAVKPKMSHQSYDNVMVQGNQIVSFKPKDKKTSVSLVNSGIYIFDKTIVEYIPEKSYSMLETDVFPQLAKRGKISAYSFQEEWLDITTDPQYQKKLKKYT